MTMYRSHNMPNEKEEIQRKLDATQLRLRICIKDLEILIGTLKPLELEHEKLLQEIKYLKVRTEKLTKILAEK